MRSHRREQREKVNPRWKGHTSEAARSITATDWTKTFLFSNCEWLENIRDNTTEPKLPRDISVTDPTHHRSSCPYPRTSVEHRHHLFFFSFVMLFRSDIFLFILHVLGHSLNKTQASRLLHYNYSLTFNWSKTCVWIFVIDNIII